MYKKVFSSSQVTINPEDTERRQKINKLKWYNKHVVIKTIRVTTVLGHEVEVTTETEHLFEGFTIIEKTKKVYIP